MSAPPPIRMISFVIDGVLSSILDSQVLMPMLQMGRHAPNVQRALLVLTSFRHRKNPRALARADTFRETLPGAQVLAWHRPPLKIPGELIVLAGYLKRAIKTCGYTGDQPIVVHCRGQTMTAAASVLKRSDPRIRVLFDLRGAEADELRGGGLLRWMLRRASARVLRVALRGADSLNTVSNKLAEHLCEHPDYPSDLPRSVIGCCVDTQRFHFDPETRRQQRAELGLSDRFVITYCGSTSAWHHRPDAVAAAAAAILKKHPDAHFLIISRGHQTLIDLLQTHGIDPSRYTGLAAKHEEVAAKLMAADVALLLRENALTNLVASPVKFAEYIRCGLPVILTHYVGDFSKLVPQEGIGATIDFPVHDEELLAAVGDLRHRLDTEGDTLRARCSQYAAKHYSWDIQIDELYRVYERLSTSASRPSSR